jgi:hypothetical protein
MNVICQTASEMHDVFRNIRVCAAAGADAIYHHGTQTDRFWLEGRIARAADYLKCMRDCAVRERCGLPSTMQVKLFNWSTRLAGISCSVMLCCHPQVSPSGARIRQAFPAPGLAPEN